MQVSSEFSGERLLLWGQKYKRASPMQGSMRKRILLEKNGKASPFIPIKVEFHSNPFVLLSASLNIMLLGL
jgi:hypothetical protein